jgi:hypothetical protein
MAIIANNLTYYAFTYQLLPLNYICLLSISEKYKELVDLLFNVNLALALKYLTLSYI